MSKQKFYNPRERFLAIAEARTNAVIEKLRILGNCSNEQLYKYNSEEISKIFRTIEAELDKSKARFSANDRRNRFKL